MFDSCSMEAPDEVLDQVRRFFFDHGHDLATSASLLGGAAAEAHVFSCGSRIEAVDRIDGRIRRSLAVIHRLLSLADVGDPNNLESALFSALDPASAEVETICLLTDMLADLLRGIDAAAGRRAEDGAGHASLAA